MYPDERDLDGGVFALPREMPALSATRKLFPAGVLLAGGASTRFGGPKGQAAIDGLTMNEISLRRLAVLCEHVAVSGGEVEAVDHTVAPVPDAPRLPSGPLSGVLSGLEWARTIGAEWVLVTPCDTPLVRPQDLAQLADAARRADSRMALLVGADGPHPLCSLWSVGLIDPLQAALSERHPAARRFAETHTAGRHLVDDVQTLVNVNAHDDLAAVAELETYFWWRESV